MVAARKGTIRAKSIRITVARDGNLALPAPMRAGSVVAARARRVPTLSLPAALAQLINRGSFHGSWLRRLVSEIANVERALLRAEAAGWIARGDYDPTVTAPGGMAWPHLEKLPEHFRSAVFYHWITVTTAWLEAADVEAVLR